MSLSIIIVTLLVILAISLLYSKLWSLAFSPLARIPGPKLYALTNLRLAYDDYRGTRTRTIHHLHETYGPVVRIGPSEVSFNSLSALRKIYGAGSAVGRPRAFYHVFDIHGHAHMFTFFSSAEHAARKKMLSQIYAKSNILSKGSSVGSIIRNKVANFVSLVERGEGGKVGDLARSLHFFALDNITAVVFGKPQDKGGGVGGATSALTGEVGDECILSDIEERTARRYSWFQLHFPMYTSLAMTCGPSVTNVLDLLGLLPGEKPIAYSGLQDYAMQTCDKYQNDDGFLSEQDDSVIARLLSKKDTTPAGAGLSDFDIAAECADHLDAGLKTTSDTLLFAIWALSLPGNKQYQERLVAEVCAAMGSELELNEDKTSLSAATCDSLPFLDAIIKETLRLYAPIPASQPRSSTSDVVIDGYTVPAGTIVSCQAYSLHRKTDVFDDPYRFDPDRWLVGEEKVAEMRRWWWPFSSGARTCLGMQ